MTYEIKNGTLELIESFLTPKEADSYFNKLLNSTPWQSGEIQLFGKRYTKPRLESFHSIDSSTYTYSGKKLVTEPFNPLLLEIKNKIESYSQHSFNSVLLNLYRDGQDSNGWHADNETELGKDPFIASLSLGAERSFKLKSNEGKSLTIQLPHGSLLLMGGAIQHYWKHCLPKSTKIFTPRINLTFRSIVS
jgi:alkylated DNA repair dioxygenase AlkB